MATPALAVVVEVKNVYGVLKVYPACPKSRLFAEIAGSKTLTHRALTQIEALGYEIVQGHRAVDLKAVA